MLRFGRRRLLGTLAGGLLACKPNDSSQSSQTAELDLNSWIQPVPKTAVLTEAGYYVWGGSVVRSPDGRFYMFYSRWPKKHGFEAWVTHSEVARAEADSPLGPFRPAGAVLPERGPGHWDGHCTHNPTVHRFDDSYYIYYTGNYGDRRARDGLNWSHRNHQRIGVAAAGRPEGPWRRLDQPLIDVSEVAGAPDSLMTSNPTARCC